METSPCPLVTPLVEFQLALLEKTRRRMLDIADGLTPAQLVAVPRGFHNNVLWNLGHLIVSQQVLCYVKSGLAPRAPGYFTPLFGKGTSPAQWAGHIDPAEVKSWLLESMALLRSDFEQHVFKSYEPYETSSGMTLTNIGEALTYVLWHESQHLGVAMALKRIV